MYNGVAGLKERQMLKYVVQTCTRIVFNSARLKPLPLDYDFQWGEYHSKAWSVL